MNKTKQKGNLVEIEGIVRSFTLASWVSETSKCLDRVREYVRTKNDEVLNKLIADGIVLRNTEQHNLIATVGRSVLAERLAGGTTYTGEINYGALGTSTTAVANSDTTLGTETYRKVAASQAFDDNIAYIDFFYTASDVSGTFEEFGNFIDGTGTVDTGQLFSHILTGSWVKSASESLFVSCQYTIN